MSAKEKSTEIEVVKTGIMAPEFMSMEDFGQGFEGTDTESFAIPFLQILQKMSPLVDEDNASYVQGAKAGMLFNTVTRKLYDGKKGVLIIPCAYRRSFIQWGGRDSADGGFKGEFTPDEILAMREDDTKIVVVDGRLYAPNAEGKVDKDKSDYFADTRSHFVLIVDEDTGEYGAAILSLASTQVRASKMLMTSLQQKKVQTPKGALTPPSYANVVRLTTVGLSNEKGNWSGAQFVLESLVSDMNVYNAAKEFHKTVIGGEAKVDYSKADQASATSGAEDAKPQDAEGF